MTKTFVFDLDGVLIKFKGKYEIVLVKSMQKV